MSEALWRSRLRWRIRGAMLWPAFVVAVAVVDMPDNSQAGQFKRLVDSPGTGNITELRGTRRVTYTGEHYASIQEGATVVNAQAEPVGRTAAALRLAELVANQRVTTETSDRTRSYCSIRSA